MNLKTTLLTIALVAPLSMSVLAGDGHHHKGMAQMAEKRAEHIIDTLQLDEGRAEEVRQIMQAAQEKYQALHEQMKAVHKEQAEKLKQVLTEDEMAQLKEARQEKMEKMRDYKKSRHSQHHGADHSED